MCALRHTVHLTITYYFLLLLLLFWNSFSRSHRLHIPSHTRQACAHYDYLGTKNMLFKHTSLERNKIKNQLNSSADKIRNAKRGDSKRKYKHKNGIRHTNNNSDRRPTERSWQRKCKYLPWLWPKTQHFVLFCLLSSIASHTHTHAEREHNAFIDTENPREEKKQNAATQGVNMCAHM